MTALGRTTRKYENSNPLKIMADENSPAPTENPAPPQTPPPAPAVPPAPTGAPPATKIVVFGEKSEREIQLERDIQTEREARRQAEFKASEAERENQRLKEIPGPAPVKKVKRSWLPAPIIGSDEEED